MPSSSSFCGDECTCENLKDSKFAVEREIFLRVRNKLLKMNSKMHDYNLLCDNFMSNIFENKISSLDFKLNHSV